MSVLTSHAPTRDDTERSLGIARRGQGRHPDPGAAQDEEAISTSLWLGLVVLVALSARVLVFVLGPAGDIDRAMDAGSEAALHQSVNLVEHGVFSAQADQTIAAPPPAQGLPGYAAVLAGARWLGLPLTAVLMLQIALGAASAALVFGIAWTLFDQKTPAIAAALAAALHPAGLVAANTLAPDTLFTTLVLAGVWLAAPRRRHDFAGSTMAGLALGLAVLVRPLSGLVGAAAAVWVMLSDRRWTGLGAAAILVAASLTPAALWMTRNQYADLPRWPAAWAGEPGRWAELASDPAAAIDRAGQLFTAQATGDLYARLGLGQPPNVEDAPLTNLAGARALIESGGPAVWLALGWSTLSALLLVGALLGLTLMLVRGQWSAAMLLAGAMLYCLVSWPGEDPQRWCLWVVGLEAVAAGSVLARVQRRQWRRWRWLRRKPAEVEDQEQTAQIVTMLSGRPL